MNRPLRFHLAVLLLLFAAGLWQPASAQEAQAVLATSPAPLDAKQVVENLVRMNRERAQALRAYQGSRTYHLAYRGFPSSRSAEMVVAVSYRSPETKEFTIRSQAGSQLIIDKVFKKLLESEKEALEAENQRRTALDTDNYVFTLVGYESTAAGSTYILALEPKVKSKFLYRGRIWVDGDDFAVTRIEAEPAKNPSFWTKNTKVEHVYVKVGDFWLPQRNHSVSRIRLGGQAELTIDYTDYRITDANPLANLQASR
jgi:hypothetical protein